MSEQKPLTSDELLTTATKAMRATGDWRLPDLVMACAGIVSEYASEAATADGYHGCAHFRQKAATLRAEAASLILKAADLCRQARDVRNRVT